MDFNKLRKAIENYNPNEFKGAVMKVYIDPADYPLYKDGKVVTGSSERFIPSDLVLSVPKKELVEISHGGVIVKIQTGGEK